MKSDKAFGEAGNGYKSMKNLVVVIMIIMPQVFFGCTRDARIDDDEIGSPSLNLEDLSSFDKYGKYGNDLTLTEVKNFSIGQKNLDLRDAGVRLTEAAFIFCTHTAKPPAFGRYKAKMMELWEDDYHAQIAEGKSKQHLDSLIEKHSLREMFFDDKVSKVYYVDYPFVVRKRLSEDFDGKIKGELMKKLYEEEADWIFLIKKMIDWDIAFKDIEFRLLTEGVGLHPEAKRRLEENGYFRAIKQLAQK